MVSSLSQSFIINQTVLPKRIACLVHLPLHENFGTACPIVWSCGQKLRCGLVWNVVIIIMMLDAD